MKKTRILITVLAITMAALLALAGCSGKSSETDGTDTSVETAETSSADVTAIENHEDGGHAIEANGENASYSDISVVKTGDSSGDEADFYGENAAVFATNGATLELTNIVVETDGTHANGVFSYDEGTTVNISDSEIYTSGNCSGGLMTTGGGTMNATDLTIHTTGNSSAAIRSDRGGGTVNVNGGTYTTDGKGSPVIYSTADITVSDAVLESTASQGVVVEGRNSVTLNNVVLIADNNTKNSDKSDYYQAVMIYQSMSGDAAEGEAYFTMNGGSLTNKNGDIFFINNTSCQINLQAVEINNEGGGIFLRAAAAGWGNEGSNGGHVVLNAANQIVTGDILVDEVSTLNAYFSEGSSFEGAINYDGEEGEVYVELSGGSTWTLTGDSYITSLTCDADSVNLNGYKLYINGVEYTEGTASKGEAVSYVVTPGNGGQGNMPPDAPPDGQGGPGGNPPDGQGGPGGNPPDGQGGPGGNPPERP
ncbi:MAG: hypothetical protein IKR67_06705 [Lachnospiraceae bacterium]|nr:hypothetical protein [Lachnospiraceae bacterium]